MMDVPIGDLLDDRRCRIWLERHLPTGGLLCPRCGCADRRLCRAHGPCPASRGRAGAGDDTRLTGTVVEQPRPRPAPRVVRRRGSAQGASTARRARAWGLARQPRQTLRQRLQAPLHATAPLAVRAGPSVEAEALDQHAGATTPAASRSRRPAPSRRP